MPRVAILIAASPTPAFYSQVAVIRLALQRPQWSSWRPSLHLYIGGPQDPSTLDRWLPHLGGVDLHWTSQAQFDRDGDWAQSDDVFRFAPSDADVLLAMDADTLPVGTLEPVLNRVLETGAVAGVIAHYPPFPRRSVQSMLPSRPDASGRHAWRRMASKAPHAPLDFSYAHTLMGRETPEDERAAPFYLNFGVVFFPRTSFDTLATSYLALRPQCMEGLVSPDFSGQVALTLAIAATRATTWPLPMRYNFPNDPIAESMYPEEMAQAAVFHYLRTEAFDRGTIFLTAEHYRVFLALRVHGVNRRFQDAVRTIVGDEYPFT
jgi:hypothetical protein